MKRFLLSLIAALMLLGASEVRAGAVETPTLVELFTSQGCSSCPPAEAYLIELAERDDLITLSMHVSYWDYIGWKDPFASEATTGRQRAYRKRISRGVMFTPQIVIDGTLAVVGSNRGAVDRAIAKAQASTMPRLAIGLALGNDESLQITVPGAEFYGGATVWLARYDDEHVTYVEHGENAGRTLRNINVVREFRKIGSWNGQPLDLRLPASALTAGEGGRDGCVIIVQDKGFGRVLGARKMVLNGGAL